MSNILSTKLFNKNKIYLEKISSPRMNLFYAINYLTNHSTHKNFIYEFKKGKNIEFYSKIFIEMILEILEYENKDEYILIPVGASTILDNEVRYKDLFEKICKKTKIENGFDCIQISFNKKPKHLDDTGIIESNLNFRLERFKDKKIILLDDVYTRGETTSFYYSQIKKGNPKSIDVITLGKTSHNDCKREQEALVKFREFKLDKIIKLQTNKKITKVLNGKNIELINNYKSYEIYNSINGVKNGAAILYHKNGNYEEYDYINGIIEGKRYLYTLTGDTFENNYINGKKETLEKRYFSTGTKSEYHVFDDKICGEYIFTNLNGEVKKLYYLNGENQEEINIENKSLFKQEVKALESFVKIFNFYNKDFFNEQTKREIKNVYIDRIHIEGKEYNYRINPYYFKKIFGRSFGSVVEAFNYPENIIIDHSDFETKKSSIEDNRYKIYLNFTNKRFYEGKQPDPQKFIVSFKCEILNDECIKTLDSRSIVRMVKKDIILVYHVELY